MADERRESTYTIPRPILLQLNIISGYIRVVTVGEDTLEVNSEVIGFGVFYVVRPGRDIDGVVLQLVDVVNYVSPSTLAVTVADEVGAIADARHSDLYGVQTECRKKVM